MGDWLPSCPPARTPRCRLRLWLRLFRWGFAVVRPFALSHWGFGRRLGLNLRRWRRRRRLWDASHRVRLVRQAGAVVTKISAHDCLALLDLVVLGSPPIGRVTTLAHGVPPPPWRRGSSRPWRPPSPSSGPAATPPASPRPSCPSAWRWRSPGGPGPRPPT